VDANDILFLNTLNINGGSIFVAAGARLSSDASVANVAGTLTGDFTSGIAAFAEDFTVTGTLTVGTSLYVAKHLTTSTLLLGGALRGPGSFSANLVIWKGGFIETPVTISSSLIFSSVPALFDYVRSHLVIDTGATASMDDTDMSVTVESGGILENKGLFTVHKHAIIIDADMTSSGPRFINAGQLVVNPGAGSMFSIQTPNSPAINSSPAFVNKGTVTINSGTLLIRAADDGNTTGTFVIATGAALQLDAPLTFGTASSIEGRGDLLLQPDEMGGPSLPITFNGALNVGGNTTISQIAAAFNSAAIFNNLLVQNTSLSGTGSLTINGTLTAATTTFNGLTLRINGTGSISSSILPAFLEVGGTLTLGLASSPAALTASVTTIDPTGLLVFGNSSIPLASAASIVNNGSIFLRWQTLSGYLGSASNPTGLIINNATLNSGGSSGIAGTTSFNNNGLIEVLRGSHFFLLSPGADSASAAVLVDSGGFLTGFRPLLAGSLTNNGSIQLSGNGKFTLGLSPSSFSFTNNASITLSNQTAALSINAAFADTASSSIDLGTKGTLTFNSPFTMQGSVSGAGTFSLALAPNTTDPGSTLSGPYSLTGTTSLSNAHATFTPSANASTAALLLSNNSALSGTLTVTSTLTLDSSTINAALTTTSANISIKQSTTTAPTLDAATLTIATNHTASVDTDATLHLQHNATLINNGTLSSAHTVTISSNATTGTLQNNGTLTLSAATTTLAADLTFQNPGAVDIQSGTLLLAAPQDPLTTGLFTVESAATLQFAADYSFAAATDPTLSGDGLLIISPSTTLTLAIDTAFSGTIQVDGALILAPARDPANQNTQPHFSILPAPIPEPTTLSLLALAAPLFLRRRR
jgi:hypothetical protein